MKCCRCISNRQVHTNEIKMSYIVVKKQSELSEYCRLCAPSIESYRKASDKGLTAKLAEENGICIPKTIYPESIQNLKLLVQKLKFPVIIKPRKRYWDTPWPRYGGKKYLNRTSGRMWTSAFQAKKHDMRIGSTSMGEDSDIIR